MISTDRIFLDPTARELARALTDAQDAINRDLGESGQRLSCDSEDAAALASQVSTQPEGSREWRVRGRGWRFSNQAELLAMWWSDWIGRKHVRIVGGRSSQSIMVPVLAPDRPLLSCIYPEHCLFVSRNRRQELLVVCGCGAWGPPEKIAWMGTQCGPCHDRQESDRLYSSTLLSRRAGVHQMAFSLDSKFLATWDLANTVSVWDVERGEVLATWDHQIGSGKMCFSPDGSRLAWGTENPRRTEWHELREEGSESAQEAYPFTFNPKTGCFILYDRGPGERFSLNALHQLEFHLPFHLHTRDMAVSPDGRLLVVAGGLQGLLFWDMTSGQLLGRAQLENVSGPLRFSPDGATLGVPVTGSSQSIALWDIAARRVRSHVCVRSSLQGFAFTPEDSLLVTAEQHDTLSTWDVKTGLERRVLNLSPGDRLLAMDLSPCGRIVALAMESGVRLWPAEILVPTE